MARRRARTDDNQKDLVAALRGAGYAVESLAALGNGVPDLLVSHRSVPHVNLLVEVKQLKNRSGDPRDLTPDQVEFFARWPGAITVATCPEDVTDWFTRRTRRMNGESTVVD